MKIHGLRLNKEAASKLFQNSRGGDSGMRADHRTVLLLLLASLGASVLLFVLLLDRYSYYDYQRAKCEAGSVGLVVSLVGSFGSDRPKERSSPYYLRVEVVGEKRGRVALSEARLTSSESKRSVDLVGIKRAEVARQGDPVPAVVYSADSLRLDYDNYVFDGVVVSEPTDREDAVTFTCALTKRYRVEWRISLWDVLMSV